MDGRPEWICRFHLSDRTVRGVGVLDVRRGERWAGRMVGAALRLPPSGTAVPVRIEIVRPGAGQQERWIREIGSRRLETRQARIGDLIVERFGPFELRTRLAAAKPGLELRLIPAGAALCLGALRLGLPRWCAPQVSADVWVRDGNVPGPPRFELRVQIRAPSVGLLLSYSGHIEERADG